MRINPVSRRYARALFELANERKILQKVYDEVLSFSNLLTRDAKLKAILFSPEIDRRRKKEIIDDLCQGKCSELTHHFLLLLINKGRQLLISEILGELAKLVDKEENRMRGIAISAVPLSSDLIESFQLILSQKFDVTVDLDNHLDSSILGGVILKTDGKVIDTSVRHQLERLAEQLVSTKVAMATTEF